MDIEEIYRQRKAVFVDRICWKIPATGDIEIDSYGRMDTIYWLARESPEGKVLPSGHALATVDSIPESAAHEIQAFYNGRA